MHNLKKLSCRTSEWNGVSSLQNLLISAGLVFFVFCGVSGFVTAESSEEKILNVPSPAIQLDPKNAVKFNYPDEFSEKGGDFKKPSKFLNKFGKTGELGFIHAFVAAVSVIIVSELGDKTFFIAAIMAMRHPRLTVFLGAITALIVMTILSACLGFATTIIPRMYTYYISTALFALFGLKMLKEGYSMSPDEGKEEYEEVQITLNKKDSEFDKIAQTQDVETGVISNGPVRTIHRKLMVFLSRIFLQSFTMTFLAEWGDRSQLTTIILAAREDAVGVTLGAAVGHAICTLLAVLGGRIVAQRISVRTVTLIGGCVFLAFAVSALVVGPGS
ncbi:transmembrane protein 165-like [Limulus polyphemus]|uniref:GDT1 family protein n=1 Tax=Limulus polyphemus TaxID=6850 RepID=A0ABM1T4D4_LIMPO|nr:transmembrane protein 165-like [Limulus polyphemus]XP_022250739.1 transmembrane protein 165-like [Limulus polyphemus]XP_022250740.1 transmembrane protein 165-like [Limulus polyphemus]